MGDSDSHSWNHHSGSCQFDICRPQQTIRTSSMHFTAINYHASAQFVLYSFMIIIVFPFYACALLEGWGWLGICTRAHMVARCRVTCQPFLKIGVSSSVNKKTTLVCRAVSGISSLKQYVERIYNIYY